jgi:hypothetical protein
MTTTTPILGFPASRLAAAKKAVDQAHARLVRGASKAGQVTPVAPRVTVTREYVLTFCTLCREVSEGFGQRCLCPGGSATAHAAVDLSIEFARPVLAGWDFLAVVEPLEGGNLLRQVPGADVSDGELLPYRSGEIVCDHCGTKRRRTETFIVRSDGTLVDAGTYKQVGRSCLGVFLGGMTAAAIIASFDVEKTIREAGEGDGLAWRGSTVHDPIEFMTWAAAIVRVDGWISKAASQVEGTMSTASRALRMLEPPSSLGRAEWERDRASYAPTDADALRGATALAWARALPESSDYERNLALVARQPHLDPKHAGILASAIAAHAKAIGAEILREARAAGVPSVHVGTVGEKKHDFGAVALERISSVDTQYGTLHIHTFRDAAGNALVWKTGKSHGEAGDKFALTAGVKAHTEYRGEQQTEMARCSLSPIAR